MPKILASLAILLLATASDASEGDFLFDVGVAPVVRNLADYATPNLGAHVSLLSGFSERTDIGLVATWDHLKGEKGTGDLDISSLAIQGWWNCLDRSIRPQIGISSGVSMDGEANASLHLAARVRALISLSTRFRLFAGVALGSDIGDKGSHFARGEFGTQFLVR